MKSKVFTLGFGLFALALSLVTAPISAEPINTDRFGLYVVADDMDRARRFYEKLFGDPEMRMPSVVGFDVAGGLYAVVSREVYAVDAIRGDTMRAYIQVSDIDETFAKVTAALPEHLEDAAVIVEGPFRFFRVRDPDRNMLELYSIDLPPSE